MLLIHDIETPSFPSQAEVDLKDFHERNREIIESYMRGLPPFVHSDDAFALFVKDKQKVVNCHNKMIKLNTLEDIPKSIRSDDSRHALNDVYSTDLTIQSYIENLRYFGKLEDQLLGASTKDDIENYLDNTADERRAKSTHLFNGMNHITDLIDYLEDLKRTVGKVLDWNVALENRTSTANYIKDPSDLIDFYRDKLGEISRKLNEDGCSLSKQQWIGELHNLNYKVQKSIEDHQGSEDAIRLFNAFAEEIKTVSQRYDSVHGNTEFQLLEKAFNEAAQRYQDLERTDYDVEKHFFDDLMMFTKRSEKLITKMESFIKRLSNINSRSSRKLANKAHMYISELGRFMDELEDSNQELLARYSLDAHIDYICRSQYGNGYRV